MKKTLVFLVLIAAILAMHSFCASNAIMDRAITLYKWKYYNDAIIELNRLITSDKEPWSTRAYFFKAHCLLSKGDTRTAEIIFKDLSDNTSFALRDYAAFYLAEIYFNDKEYEKAYIKLKDFYPGSALRPEADIKMAECLFELGDIDKAIGIYKGLLAVNSSLTPMDKVRFNLGKCYERAGKAKEALAAYHQINLYNPISPLAKQGLTRVNHLSKKHKISPDAASAEDIFNKAMVYYNFGDYGSATVTFQKIVSNYRKSSLWEEALFKLALCNYKRKKISSAITRFKICVDHGGDFADASQFYMAFAYGKGGYFYQALDSLNKVVINYPNSQYADDAAYYLGYYYESNGFKDTALDHYSRFVQQYPKSEFTDDAYWKIGRLYYFKRDYQKACDMFSKAIENCNTGDWLDACAYWEALSQEKMGNKWEAISSYRFVVSRFDHTYYSYRAREKLVALGAETENTYGTSAPNDLDVITDGPFAQTPLSEEPLPFEAGFTENTTNEESLPLKAFNIKEHFRKYTELMAIGFYNEAAKEASILVAVSPGDKKISAKLALATANLGAGQIKDSILYAEVMCNNAIYYGTSSQLPRSAWNLAYPKGYFKSVSQYANEFGIDELLVLAVIREESRFNPKTLSWANARGLMQIIPQTGLGVARLIGIKPYHSGKLYEADVNIRMGCCYLASLLKRFNNNKVLALAAYNGGPLRVKKWMTKAGPDIDYDEFIENIPLSETKRYVQKVMKSYYEYKRLYSGDIKYPQMNYI